MNNTSFIKSNSFHKKNTPDVFYKPACPIENLNNDDLQKFYKYGVTIFGTGNYGSIIHSALKKKK